MGRAFLPALLLCWAAFAAWCVAGVPPCVDLPAHGAQLETLVGLLRGDPALQALYEVRFPLGYGLPYWLFLPVAWLWNGSVGVRLAMWAALMLFPLSQLALVRAFKRPDWTLLLGLPLAFNLSYWYGLLSGLFAQPFVFLALAAFARALETRERKWLWWTNLAAAAAMLSHLVAFAALAVALGVWVLFRRPFWPAVRALAASLTLPVLVVLPKVYAMATRAVVPGPWPPTEYDALSHLNWFFKMARGEGQLVAVAPLAVAAAMLGLWLWRRRSEPREPAVLFFALAVLYVVTPKTLSGIFLISVRLPVLAGMLALVMADASVLPKWLQGALVALCLASLGETALFHQRFARSVDGLAQVTAEPPHGRHGYVSLVGRATLGSKHPYLDHLGQWWTARDGGLGHNFFADAEHHPVHFKPGVEVPADLWDASPQTLAWFDELLVYGEVPLPPGYAGFKEVLHVGAWRKLAKRPSPVTEEPPPSLP